MAGYSATPLAKKLGISAGRLLVLNEPAGFQAALGALPKGVERTSSLAGRNPFDVAVVFVRRRAGLDRAFARVTARMTVAGGVWIAWPKRTSGVETDVTEDVLREVILPLGLVDRKVCAIDATWSGLLFSWRRRAV